MTPENIDNYQEKRADRREKRGVKKGEGTFNASGDYVPTDANSKFNQKTEFIRNKSEKKSNLNKDKLLKAYADGLITKAQYEELIK